MDAMRKVDSNQRNKAKTGGGPRTAAGKRRSRLNARKHGLSIPVTADRQLNKIVLKLARLIAGEGANDAMLNQAVIVADCELTLQRIRRARLTAIESAGAISCNESHKAEATEVANAFVRALPILSSVERYERRAYSRRKKALKTLSDLQFMAQLHRELGSA